MDETRGYDLVTGTREELIEELEERATGWHHMASDKKRDRALEAVQSLKDGSFSVRVGRTIYTVAGAAVPGNRAAGDETAVNADDSLPDQRGQRDETADNPVS
ncbi:hypothetical protein ACFYZ4_15025 [Streptomyces sp. NPDC001513]|uniref:hypothetical protein n=1 Tax=Streptomyces sp. NPDC001513 TaxID=3364580 RepID=UPI0036CB1634